MSKICLIIAQEQGFNVSQLFAERFRGAGYAIDEDPIPPLWRFDRRYVSELRHRLEVKGRNAFTILMPPGELFASEADLIISFSGYRSWFDPQRMRIIPHLWPPSGFPATVDDLIWKSKPALSVGFMGRTFASSAVVRLMTLAPTAVKTWLLEGGLVRMPSIAAFINETTGYFAKGYNCFARLETLQTIKPACFSTHNGVIRLEAVEGFNGGEEQVSAYRRHLAENTYIICPRGTENYSYRMYETLAHGRVPVIIDTDIMLPTEIDWTSIALIVPYKQLRHLNEILIRDYVTRTQEEFIDRQKRAFKAIETFRSLRWIDGVVEFVSRRLSIENKTNSK